MKKEQAEIGTCSTCHTVIRADWPNPWCGNCGAKFCGDLVETWQAIHRPEHQAETEAPQPPQTPNKLTVQQIRLLLVVAIAVLYPTATFLMREFSNERAAAGMEVARAQPISSANQAVVVAQSKTNSSIRDGAEKLIFGGGRVGDRLHLVGTIVGGISSSSWIYLVRIDVVAAGAPAHEDVTPFLVRVRSGQSLGVRRGDYVSWLVTLTHPFKWVAGPGPKTVAQVDYVAVR